MSTVVVALGGNALIKQGESGTYEELTANADQMAAAVAQVAAAGFRVVVTHGNGPQVGNLAIQHHQSADTVPALPLHLIGAMTQGYLGSLIVRALADRLPQLRDRLVAIVTHALVDLDAPGSAQPTKPIGPYLTAAEAEQASAMGWTVAEDAGRGLRRIVSSPLPLGIVEAAAIRTLVEQDFVVVAGGGGGIPTAETDAGLVGVDAVIDKDRLAVHIARCVDADALALVTSVDRVLVGFGTPDQHPVAELTTAEARTHLAGGEFPPGSMGPKIEAAIDFVEGGGGYAIITSAARLSDALAGEGGTRVVSSSRP